MEFDNKRKRKICNPTDTKEDKGEFDTPVSLDEIVEDFLIRTRRLMLVGEVNDIASAHICSYIQMLSCVDKPIYLYINSPGGCVSSGYAIIDQMIACECPIFTIVRGQAHSMGAMIAAFGDKGHRHITPNSSMMLHSVIIQNPPEHIERYSRMFSFIEDDYDKKIQDLSSRLKLNKKKLAQIMNDTKWMSPSQAIKIGLVDSVWTPKMENSINRSA